MINILSLRCVVLLFNHIVGTKSYKLYPALKGFAVRESGISAWVTGTFGRWWQMALEGSRMPRSSQV